MIEAKNDIQLVDERFLADEWQTTATPEPEIIAHLFGLYGKATERDKKDRSDESDKRQRDCCAA